MNQNTAEILGAIFSTLDEALRLVVGDPVADIADAILEGNPTDEQLSTFTDVVHDEFDAHDGCMITAIKELTEVGVPHYALNHVIRTYVRLCDKREQETAYAAKEREEEAYKRMSGAPGYGA